MKSRFAIFGFVASLIAAVPLGLVGCSSSSAANGGDAGSGTTTTDNGTSCADQGTAGPVFEDAFTNYTSWTSYTYDTAEDAGPHASGPRTEWINHVPPHGCSDFPQGTIIVKSIKNINQIFAMEKRGQDYDLGGAENWEFFELEPIKADGTSDFIWRGSGPPLGETYGGDPTACNGCHSGFKSNDYIPSPPLQLENF